MKYLFFILSLCIIVNTSAQEFKEYSNGLIYDSTTINKLSSIVDSLNLKYSTCELDKTYLSKKQARAHWVRANGNNAEKAFIDIKNNKSYKDLKEQVDTLHVVENGLVVMDTYENYDGDQEIEFSLLTFRGRRMPSLTIRDNVEKYNGNLKGQWVYYKGDDYLEAIYFENGIQSTKIPEKYSRIIGYADCLIDTNVSKFKEDLENGWVELPNNYNELSQFQKDTLLERMRSTRVVGFCSMDSRPRTHAVNIAKLSASSANWEVFLKAHLDIMNDRFERISDGSYAWESRKTYIKELEQLDINVHDLILGISFRMENPSKNHYYASNWRVGRALSESSDKKGIKNRLLSIMQDKSLDGYNRIIAFYLFNNIDSYTDDTEEKKENRKALLKAMKSFPKSWQTELGGKLKLQDKYK